MDDKVFELMEKMYSDLNSKMDSMATKQDIDGVKEDVRGVKEDVSGVKEDVSGVKQQIVRLEDKMDTNHKVLHDGYKQTYEKLTDVDGKLDRQEEILKGHDLQIKVMRK